MKQDKELLDYILSVDEALSYGFDNTRIFYFLSEESDIIDDLLDHSSRLAVLIEKLLPSNAASQMRDDIRNGKMNGNALSPEDGSRAREAGQGNCARWLREKGWMAEFTGEKPIGKGGAKDASGHAPRIYTLRNFHVYGHENGVQDGVFKIAKFLESFAQSGEVLLISSPVVKIPVGFEDQIKLVKVGAPTARDIQKLYGSELNEIFDSEANSQQIENAAQQLRGFSRKVTQDILQRVLQAKQAGAGEMFDEIVRGVREEVAQKDIALNIHDLRDATQAVGMGAYTNWLLDNRDAFRDPQKEFRLYGTHAPKGVLMVGVPGTGKTAMAEQTARVLGDEGWPLPLLELRIDAIQSDRYGGSEANLNRYLDRAESLAPCVLLIDEIEKTFRRDNRGSNHEVRMAMLNILLKWMQGRKANVFVFITANSVDNMPPELLRNGRLSERFFVFLPTRDDLAEILCCKMCELGRDMGWYGDAASANALEGTQYAIDPKHYRAFTKLEPCKTFFDSVAKDSEGVPKFFTGADVGTMIDKANTLLKRWKGRREKGSSSGAQDERQAQLKRLDEAERDGKNLFEAALREAAQEVVTQGEAGLKQIIDTWFSAKDNNYNSASDRFFFPFREYGKYETERRSKGSEREAADIFRPTFEKVAGKQHSDYDSALFKRICEEIDEVQSYIDEHK